jgi:hypothetical protein
MTQLLRIHRLSRRNRVAAGYCKSCGYSSTVRRRGRFIPGVAYCSGCSGPSSGKSFDPIIPHASGRPGTSRPGIIVA